jgi:hypothetical protein
MGISAKKKKQKPYKGKPGNKRRKLDEASYFFNCMIANEHKTGLFQFYYSAFLSAARSVLQYAHEEVHPDCNPDAKLGALKWYQKTISKSQVIKFGRDERDENIHFAPVIPDNSVTIIPEAKVSALADVFYTYSSSRWKGPEDLQLVCRVYLDELEALVKNGISKGYIAW